MTNRFWVSLSIGLLLFMFGCGGDANAPTNTDDGSAATLTGITITPNNDVGLIAGGTAHLKATGSFSDGTTADMTAQVLWGITSTSSATVASDGIVTGVASGTTTITATDISGTVSGNLALTVLASAEISILSGAASKCENAHSPATLFVPVGTQVTWTNTDGTHTVTSTNNSSGCPPGGNTIIGEINSSFFSGTFSNIFNSAGTFHYACQIGSHTMRATVIVE